jgi:hypothetical protein
MKPLNQEKLTKWVNNSLVFTAPLFILYLVTIQDKILADGITLSDFALDQTMIGAMSLYIINVLLDFFKKYKAS